MKKVLNQIKFMKKNRPELFQQFLFGIAMVALSLLQAVAVLHACVFL